MTPTPATIPAAPRTLLDVRSVEPKDRLRIIMTGYHGLNPRETMELIVDHDPKCIYYTLRATHGEATFRFEYLEEGPLDWRVAITRFTTRDTT